MCSSPTVAVAFEEIGTSTANEQMIAKNPSEYRRLAEQTTFQQFENNKHKSLFKNKIKLNLLFILCTFFNEKKHAK